MPKARNTYNKGLNQDVSRSKYSPGNYYDALNIRLVTHDGLSTGSIENEKGNSLTFEIPDIPAQNIYYPSGESVLIPAQTGLQIIGWTTVSNYIILFTTNETAPTEVGGVTAAIDSIGQIWRIEYNEATNTIIDVLAGGLLDVNEHLVYNNKLDLTSYARIEAEGRFEKAGRFTEEDDAVARVYWTDNYNQLRTANILDPDLAITKPDLLNITPNVTFAQAYPTALGVGDLPAGGMVQIGYRLISPQGAQTGVSPLSALVHLVEEDPYSTPNKDYLGAAFQQAFNKSVTFNIRGLDTDYKTIEYIAVLYENEDAPQIFKFGEAEVPFGGTVNITLTGAETRIDLTLVELNAINVGFDVCKTITAKDNRLIAGNVITSKVEIDDDEFDARAYRFNASQEARIDDSDGTSITIGVPAPPYDVIPSDHDAINLFNNERPSLDWTNDEQYKYQSDGVTIGGEGANIKYQFITEALTVDTQELAEHNIAPPHTDVPRYTSSVYSPGILHPDGALVSISLNGTHTSFASPLVQSYFTGYTRGEIYRFGIQFITKKGVVTFVKWIGDIKFPEPSDGFSTGGGTLDAESTANSLGIRFTVDISSIRDQISGFRIVRAERTASDVSRHGTGTIMIMDSKQDDNERQATAIYEVTSEGNEALINDVEVDGNKGSAKYHLADAPGLNRYTWNPVFGPPDSGVHVKFPSSKNMAYLISPFSTMPEEAEFEFKPGDYYKVNGYYQSRAIQYSAYGVGDAIASQLWKFKCYGFEAPSYPLTTALGYDSYEINKMRYLKPGEVIDKNTSYLADVITGNDVLNTSYGWNGTGVNHPLGIGDETCFTPLVSNPTSGHRSPSTMEWNSNVLEGTNKYNRINASDNPSDLYLVDQVLRWKEVSYVRPLTIQYGGNTFEDRSKQEYISTNHWQPVTDAVPDVMDHEIYGGDTYVNFFDKEWCHQYVVAVQHQGRLEDPSIYDRKMSLSVYMVMESRINTDITYGRSPNRDRSKSSTADYVLDSYGYNEVYKQENNAIISIAKDFTLKDGDEFPHRLWASDAKLDGEFLDSWRSFKDANKIDVEGSFGPVNKVINFQDRVFYYQDRAFGIASVNERSLITDSSGVEVAIGTGDVLDAFRYVSTTTGTRHQFCVVNSGNSLYHYDTEIRKFYRYNGQGTQPLSDVAGLSSYFANTIEGEIVNTDFTLREAGLGGPVGIHSTFDYRHNRVLFTFLNSGTGTDREDITIGYNEFLNGFESFYSFDPNMYINTGRRLISINPDSQDQAYMHDEGEYGTFYDRLPDESFITLIINPDADVPKIFNNIEYNSELSLAGVDIPDETISQLEIWNDYQTTGVIPLIVPANVKRRLRHWRHAIARDSTSSTQRARMRDYSIFLKLTFQNNTNKRLVLHDIITSYTITRD